MTTTVELQPVIGPDEFTATVLEEGPPPLPWRQWLEWAAHFSLMAVITIASLLYGLGLRRQAWVASEDIHFRTTMNNCMQWGHQANEVGLLAVYQQLVDEFGTEGRYKELPNALALDYPPLRLMIIAKWEDWTEKHFERRNPYDPKWYWQRPYEFTRPMLELNTGCELAGAVAMFLLVHYWLRRCAGAPPKPWLDPVTGCWQGLLAALLLWFDPAVIFNAHCYPQWDVWILAPFLLAVYFGLLDLWLISGLLIGFVAMGKGQILLVTPVLVVWQLCIWRPGAVLQLLIGILLAAGGVASPWLLSPAHSFTWFWCVLIALARMIPLFISRDWSKQSIIFHSSIVAGAVILVLWPWARHPWSSMAGLTFLSLIAFAVAARYLPVRWAPAWFAGGTAAALFGCIPLFTAPDTPPRTVATAWYYVGIKGPTRNWPLLYWCKAYNLGAILQEDFNWEWHEDINLDDYLPKIDVPIIPPEPLISPILHPYRWFLQQIQHPWQFPMRYLMLGAYGLVLILCGVFMAVHQRRKSPMFFFAMVAPWVLMFTLLPQMQNRYLLWGAAFSAATAAISLDGFMLYLLLAVINVINTAYDMMRYAPQSKTSVYWLPRIEPLFPDLAWGMLLIAAIWFYLAIPRWRNRQAIQVSGATA